VKFIPSHVPFIVKSNSEKRHYSPFVFDEVIDKNKSAPFLQPTVGLCSVIGCWVMTWTHHWPLKISMLVKGWIQVPLFTKPLCPATLCDFRCLATRH